MRVATTPWRRRAGLGVLVVAGMLTAPGCVLNEDDPPPLNGPSETGLSVQLKALPDTVNADGQTRSTVELILRDQNGNPASGRAVLFRLLSGDGRMVPSAASTYVGPVQTGLVLATSETGQAVVIYVAGKEPNTIVRIGVRPYNIDYTRNTYIGQNDFLAEVEIVQR
jgi:hypothetical protein